jgi:hypothetical protein
MMHANVPFDGAVNVADVADIVVAFATTAPNETGAAFAI